MEYPLKLTPSQITRGVAIRRYAFGKPIKQIADEAGLPVKNIYDVIKGLPFNLEVAARLEGYLLTPVTRTAMQRDRNPDGEIGATRKAILKRILRGKALAAALGQGFGRRKEDLSCFTDAQLRAYCYNVEDRLKYVFLQHYPWIAERYKFADDMEPWEVIERIHDLKDHPKARDATRYSVEAQKAALSRERAESDQFFSRFRRYGDSLGGPGPDRSERTYSLDAPQVGPRVAPLVPVGPPGGNRLR